MGVEVPDIFADVWMTIPDLGCSNRLKLILVYCIDLDE